MANNCFSVGRRVDHPSIDSRLASYQDENDAERLSIDSAMHHVAGGRTALADKRTASTIEAGRFEMEILNTSSNLSALMRLSRDWIDKGQSH